MAVALSFELRIEERGPTRVVVSVLLAPEEDGARLDGVALQLVGRLGDPLSAQMVLPIAGELRHAMLSTVKLEAEGEIPQGARVVGTAWCGSEQREATVPTDPFTDLQVHLLARRRIPGESADVDLEPLLREERAILAHAWPWIDGPRLPRATAELTVVENEEPLADEELFDGLVEDLGLDADCAEWLKDLLSEDDDALVDG